MEVSTGSATIQWSNYLGGGWYSVHRSNVGGLAFYRGGKRLTPSQALKVIGDKKLESTYRLKLNGLKRKRSSSGKRLFGGMATALAGTVIFPVGMIGGSAPLAIIGGVAMIGGLIVELTGINYGKYRRRHEVYRDLFIEGALISRLTGSMLDFNARAARKCGYGGRVDIPMPATLKTRYRNRSDRPAPRRPTTPDGTNGGRCYGNGTCNNGLTCVRGVCTPSAADGNEGGKCYGNGTCNQGLRCSNGTCVR
jgi:hypothetical protein